ALAGRPDLLLGDGGTQRRNRGRRRGPGGGVGIGRGRLPAVGAGGAVGLTAAVTPGARPAARRQHTRGDGCGRGGRGRQWSDVGHAPTTSSLGPTAGRPAQPPRPRRNGPSRGNRSALSVPPAPAFHASFADLAGPARPSRAPPSRQALLP